jgi:endonuclease YncB( thermonuclease family)
MRQPSVYWEDYCFTVVLALGVGLAFGAIFDRELLGDPIPWFPAAAEAVDGDTIRVTVLLHLDGVDAPELDRMVCPEERGKGERTRDRANELLREGSVRVKVLGEDSFGRMRARLVGGDRPLAQMLLREGLVQPTTGAGHWCPDDAGADPRAAPGPELRALVLAMPP